MKGTYGKLYGKSGRSGAVLAFACLFIMAMALVFGFAACDSDGDDDGGNTDPKSVTITGLSMTGSVTVVLSDSTDANGNMPAGGTATISGNSVTIALKTFTGTAFTTTAWTETGDYYVAFWNAATPSGSPSHVGHDGSQGKISFSSATTTVPWSQFVAID